MKKLKSFKEWLILKESTIDETIYIFTDDNGENPLKIAGQIYFKIKFEVDYVPNTSDYHGGYDFDLIDIKAYQIDCDDSPQGRNLTPQESKILSDWLWKLSNKKEIHDEIMHQCIEEVGEKEYAAKNNDDKYDSWKDGDKYDELDKRRW